MSVRELENIFNRHGCLNGNIREDERGPFLFIGFSRALRRFREFRKLRIRELLYSFLVAHKGSLLLLQIRVT